MVELKIFKGIECFYIEIFFLYIYNYLYYYYFYLLLLLLFFIKLYLIIKISEFNDIFGGTHTF